MEFGYHQAMFSYRHAFHAGNHADVLKHLTLVATLKHLMHKEPGITLIDTHAGAGLYRLDGDYAETVNTSTGANAFSPGFCPGQASGTALGDCGGDDNGLEYAGRIGFDIQSGNIVFGALVEGSKSKAVDFASAYSTTPAGYHLSRELDYAASVRGRLGFTPDSRVLMYATGGGSYARIKHGFSTTNSANSFTPTDNDSMVWGWQAGGGAEVKLGGSLTFGLEYLYNRYNDNKYYVAVGQGTAPATNPFLLNGGGTNLRMADTRFDNHSIRATVGFHF